jgi:hypothetical protein
MNFNPTEGCRSVFKGALRTKFKASSLKCEFREDRWAKDEDGGQHQWVAISSF